MWNGEAWRFRGEMVGEGNDTRIVFKALMGALAGIGIGVGDAGERSRIVKDVLGGVTGPFAFVFYAGVGGRVLYGRDAVGRRSLMRSWMGDGEVWVASVSDGVVERGWEEVQTGGIYELDLKAAGTGMENFMPWGESIEVSYQSLLSNFRYPSTSSGMGRTLCLV